MRKINEATAAAAFEAAVEQPDDATEGADGKPEWMSEFTIWIAETDHAGVILDIEHMRMGGKDNWSVRVRHSELENRGGQGTCAVSKHLPARVSFYDVSPLNILRYVTWTSLTMKGANYEDASYALKTLFDYSKINAN